MALQDFLKGRASIRVRSESDEYSPSLVKFTGLRSERHFTTTFSNMG